MTFCRMARYFWRGQKFTAESDDDDDDDDKNDDDDDDGDDIFLNETE